MGKGSYAVPMPGVNASKGSVTSFGSGALLIPVDNSQDQAQTRERERERKRKAKQIERRVCLRRTFGIIAFLICLISVCLGFLALIGHLNFLKNLTNSETYFFGRKWNRNLVTRTYMKRNHQAELGVTHKCQTNCLHWRNRSDSQMIMHDTKTRWSALVNYDKKRCLMFSPMSKSVRQCPVKYPWVMDAQMGLLPCRFPVDSKREMVGRVIRLFTCNPMANISLSGSQITKACQNFSSHRVMAVFVSYTMFKRELATKQKREAVEAKPEADALTAPSAYVFTDDGLIDEQPDSETEIEIINFDSLTKDEDQGVNFDALRKLSKV